MRIVAKKINPAKASATDPRQTMAELILGLIVEVPPSNEQAFKTTPELRALALGRAAARKASLMAGSLALPPGLLAWLTILPELLGVWKLQAQMVSDIAAVFGKHGTLSREQMIYCLFKQVSAQLFRDMVMRVGERYVIHAASSGLVRSIAQTLGVKITQNLMLRSSTRLIPLLGAIGVGAYAYFDTLQVARTAIDLFAKDIVLDATNRQKKQA